MAGGAKYLAVNADDFGFTRDVNAGIVEARVKGILTSATLMANGAAFDDAVRLAREHPELDVGVHIVLVGGQSVLRPERALPRSAGRLAAAVALGRIDVYAELHAQMEKIVAAGIRPTHADTHKHTHLLGPVLEAVARLGEEYAVPADPRALSPHAGAAGVRDHRLVRRFPDHRPLRGAVGGAPVGPYAGGHDGIHGPSGLL